MPVAAQPTSIGGLQVAIARENGDGPRKWAAEFAPADPSDLLPHTEVVTLSPFGIGSSTPAVPGQADVFYDCEVAAWDYLGPGYYIGQLGYSMDSPVTCFATLRGGVVTVGPGIPGTMASSGGGSAAWATPSNIAASDGAYATATVSAVQSHYLHATNVSWVQDGSGAAGLPTTIADTMTIHVIVEAKASIGGVVTLHAQLIKGGVRTGAVLSASGTLPTTDGSSQTIVGFTTLFTRAELEASDTGVAMFCTSGAASAAVTVSIDSVQMAAIYFNPVTIDSETARGFVAAGADDAGAGTVSWTAPSAIVESSDTYATAVLTPVTSEALRATNFSLAAATEPATIAVELEAKVSAGSCTYVLALIVGGTVAATTRATVMTSTTDTTVVVSGTPAEWGVPTLSVVQVNDATFGVAILATNASTTALVASVDRVRLTVSGNTRTPLLYAGAGDTLKKIAYDNPSGTPTWTLVESKTFTGTTGTPAISDLFSPKDGTTSGAPYLVVAFGRTAQIAQVSAVSLTGADTYTTPAATPAYAGVLGRAMGQDNTQLLMWKSMPNGGTSSTVGAFSNIQSAALLTTDVDLTDANTWIASMPTPLPVGEQGTDITALLEFERGLVVLTPEGAYFFDQNSNSFNAFGTYSFRHDENGRNALVAGNHLFIPTIDDLMSYEPFGNRAAVGLTTLVAHTSEQVVGYPTALANKGETLYVSYYDGADSVLCRQRLRTGSEVPHPFIIEPIHRFAGFKMEAAQVIIDANGTSMLVFSCPSAVTGKFDIGYITLDPVSRRRYQSGADWSSTEWGSTEKRTILEQITCFAIDCSATDYWTLSTSADRGAFNAVGDLITTNGRIARSPVAGTNDDGYLWVLRAQCVLSSNLNRPRLRGSTSTERGAAGFVVQSMRQADYTEVIRASLRLGAGVSNDAGGFLRETAVEAYSTLKGFTNDGLVDLVDEHYFGDRTAQKVYVQVVGYREGRQLGTGKPEREVDVLLRRPLSRSD